MSAFATGLDDSFGLQELSPDEITSPYRQNPHPTAEDLDQEYVRLRRNNVNLKFRCLALEEQLISLQSGLPAEVPELQLRVVALEAELQQLRGSKRESDEERSGALASLRKAELRCREIDAQLAGARAEADELRSRYEPRLAEAASALQELQARQRGLESGRVESSERITQLELECASLRDDAEQLPPAQAALRDARERAATLDVELRAAQQRLLQCDEGRHAAQRDRAAERDRLRADADAERTKVEALRSQVASLTEAAEAASRQRDADVAAERVRWEQLAESGQRAAAAQRGRDLAEKERLWQQEVAALREELAMSQDDVRLGDSRARRREGLLVELQQALSGVEQDRARLRDQVLELERAVTGKEDEVRELAEQLEDMQAQQERALEAHFSEAGIAVEAEEDSSGRDGDDGEVEGSGVEALRRGTLPQALGVDAVTSPIGRLQLARGCDAMTSPMGRAGRACDAVTSPMSRTVPRGCDAMTSPFSPKQQQQQQGRGCDPMTPVTGRHSAWFDASTASTPPRRAGRYRTLSLTERRGRPVPPVSPPASPLLRLPAHSPPASPVPSARSLARASSKAGSSCSVDPARRLKMDEGNERLRQEIAALRDKAQQMDDLVEQHTSLQERMLEQEGELRVHRASAAENDAVRIAALRLLEASYLGEAHGVGQSVSMDAVKLAAALGACSRSLHHVRTLVSDAVRDAGASADRLFSRVTESVAAVVRRVAAVSAHIAGVRGLLAERERLRAEARNLRSSLSALRKEAADQTQRCAKLQEEGLASAEERIWLEFDREKLRGAAENSRAARETLTLELQARADELDRAQLDLRAQKEAVQRREQELLSVARHSADVLVPAAPRHRDSGSPNETARERPLHAADDRVQSTLQGLRRAFHADLASLRQYVDECGWGQRRLGIGQGFVDSVAQCIERCGEVIADARGLVPRGASPERSLALVHQKPLLPETVMSMVHRLDSLCVTLRDHQEQREASFRALSAKIADCQASLSARLDSVAVAAGGLPSPPRTHSPRPRDRRRSPSRRPSPVGFGAAMAELCHVSGRHSNRRQSPPRPPRPLPLLASPAENLDGVAGAPAPPPAERVRRESESPSAAWEVLLANLRNR